jgi:hypothetical protein
MPGNLQTENIVSDPPPHCSLSHYHSQLSLSLSLSLRPPLWSSGQSSWLQNGDVLFLVKYELNFICYVEESRPPL